MYKLEDLKVGMKESYSQTITDADIKWFAGLSGDRNPVHLDDNYAALSKFQKRIAHGMLSASFFSALFGMKLPGPGCVLISQSLKFRKPVFINDSVVATVEVKDINWSRRIIVFNIYCKVENCKVITGEAEIYMPN